MNEAIQILPSSSRIPGFEIGPVIRMGDRCVLMGDFLNYCKDARSNNKRPTASGFRAWLDERKAKMH